MLVYGRERWEEDSERKAGHLEKIKCFCSRRDGSKKRLIVPAHSA